MHYKVKSWFDLNKLEILNCKKYEEIVILNTFYWQKMSKRIKNNYITYIYNDDTNNYEELI